MKFDKAGFTQFMILNSTTAVKHCHTWLCSTLKTEVQEVNEHFKAARTTPNNN